MAQILSMARPRGFTSPARSIKSKLARPLPNPRRLLLLSVTAILLLVVTVVGAILFAVQSIDNASIASELARAQVALELVTADGSGPGTSLAARLAHDFALVDAHFIPVSALGPDDIALVVPRAPDTALVWSPRRFGSEMFLVLAPVRLLASAVFLGGIGFFIFRLYGLAHELEERRRSAQELAARDSLTGLGNRLAFDQRLQQAFSEETGVALLYLDLDDFKQVNDTLGHGAGDELLKSVATRLGQVARTDDLVARIGGDEFGILRTSVTTRDDLAELAADVGVALGEAFRVGNKAFSIKASIGIALAPDDATTATELVKVADEALYRAKATRGGFTFAQADRSTSATRGT